jgi:hypothetical protein
VNKKATIQRQLIAGCLLVVFLFITGARLFHSHETKPATRYSFGVAHVEETSDCAICDYHLAKDAYHLTGFLQVKKAGPLVSSHCSYNTPFVTSIGSASSGRGPPAQV